MAGIAQCDQVVFVRRASLAGGSDVMHMKLNVNVLFGTATADPTAIVVSL
jgi:hypothetical protein